MTFRDKHGRTADITMTGINGVNWEASFFDVGSLPYDEETDAYTVDDIDMLLDAARNYCNHSGDYDWIAPKYEAEDATIVYVDGEYYAAEDIERKEAEV